MSETDNKTETESRTNRGAENYGWPPEVPRNPDTESYNQWTEEIWLYSWMAAAHTEQISKKLDTQNELLKDIRDELQKPG